MVKNYGCNLLLRRSHRRLNIGETSILSFFSAGRFELITILRSPKPNVWYRRIIMNPAFREMDWPPCPAFMYYFNVAITQRAMSVLFHAAWVCPVNDAYTDRRGIMNQLYNLPDVRCPQWNSSAPNPRAILCVFRHFSFETNRTLLFGTIKKHEDFQFDFQCQQNVW